MSVDYFSYERIFLETWSKSTWVYCGKELINMYTYYKRGKQYTNNGLYLWSDVYQDHGFWLVCLHQLDLLVVKLPVTLCD